MGVGKYRCESRRARVRVGSNEHTHLRVFFNPCSLLANARLVRLGVDDFQQIQGIVDASGRVALGLLGSIVGLVYVHGINAVFSRAIRGLGALFFGASLLRGGFLDRRACFLLGEQTGGFGLAGELFLAFCLLVDILILFCTLFPFGCVRKLLSIPIVSAMVV